jgi:hypothetical protein
MTDAIKFAPFEGVDADLDEVDDSYDNYDYYYYLYYRISFRIEICEMLENKFDTLNWIINRYTHK